MRAYCLSIHASYRCAHAGACCTSGWPIPIELDSVYGLRTRRLARADTFIEHRENPPGHLRIAKTAGGACLFHDEADRGLCTIQRDAGVELMPSACRNFPRVALADSRGVFVTLSHYCPTAARLLLADGPIAIVAAPPAISLQGHVEGLDARDVMPPLLRPDMLVDLDGYSVWEQEGLAVLNAHEHSAAGAIRVIAEATRDACEWSPGPQSLASRIRAAFERARSAHTHQDPDAHRPFERALKRFLASHLFASWEAYRPGAGLAAVVERVQCALSLAGQAHGSEASFIAAVRQTDLQLRHT